MSANGQGIVHGAEVVRAAKKAVRTAIESRLAGLTAENKAEQSQKVLHKVSVWRHQEDGGWPSGRREDDPLSLFHKRSANALLYPAFIPAACLA